VLSRSSQCPTSTHGGLAAVGHTKTPPEGALLDRTDHLPQVWKGSIVWAMTAVVAAVVSAIAVLAAALLTAFAAPTWKSRHDRRRETQETVARYSRPLVQAAFELQSRLYNIVRLGLFTPGWLGDDPDRRGYAETSTLWLISQYLGWMEILRREVQFLELEDITQTRQLRDRLLEVRDLLATDRISDRRFQVNRSDQRAIGELMIVRRRGDKGTRSDCRGYAEFVEEVRDPNFDAWLKSLRRSIAEMIDDGSIPARLVFVQRALIDLIDLLDPKRSVFPHADERGKLPLPSGYSETANSRPWERLARFKDDVGWRAFEEWAAAKHLEAGLDPWKRSVASGNHRFGVRLVLRAERRDGWLTLSGWAEAPPWARATRLVPEQLPLARGGWRFMRSRTHARRLANDLLERYDRPLLL
jgi:hypothetical protein